MADRVNASMNAVQPPSLRSLGDGASTQTRFFKLLQRDDAVLPTRDRGNSHIAKGGFVSHEDTKPPRAAISPPYTSPDSTNSTKVATTLGSNCVPAQRCSSARAASVLIALR